MTTSFQNDVQDIYVNVGTLAASGYIHDFFSKNYEQLCEAGICYPDFSDKYDKYFPGQRAAYTLLNVALSSPQAMGDYLKPLRNLSSISKTSANPVRKLVISCASFFRCQQAIHVFQNAFHSLFPNAAIHYFASFCHQVHEISALTSYRVIAAKHNLNAANGYIQQAGILDYSSSIGRWWEEGFRDNFHIHLSHVNKRDFNQLGKDALDEFLKFMNIDLHAFAGSLDKSPPSWLLPFVPREFLDIVSRINNIQKFCANKTKNDQDILNWSAQLPNVANKLDALSPVLDKQTQEKINNLFKYKNKKLSDFLLGEEDLGSFVLPGAGDGYTLSYGKVKTVIEALDGDFRNALRESIETLERPDCAETMFIKEACRELDESCQGKMKHEVSVDVLSLAYNQEKYIGECIESVLAQKTDFPVRHIIVDDASTDNTANIIAEYANAHPDRIMPIFLQKRTRGNNVATLFRMCDSKYAALCDGDDYFTDPLKLQKQVDFLEAHPECALCFHPVSVVYEDGSPSRIYPTENMLRGGARPLYTIKDLLHGNMIQTNSVMYRWRFQDGLPSWFDPTLVPGDWYWHLLHAETGLIGYLPDNMATYRRHPASLYATAESDHVMHRAKHGFKEMRVYDVCDKHFRGRYHDDFQILANGIFADWVKIFCDSDEDTLLQEGVKEFPLFARQFLSELKNVQKTHPKPTGDKTAQPPEASDVKIE